MNQTYLPLSKEQLGNWVIHLAKQHTNGAIVIDCSQPHYPIIFCNEPFHSLTGFNNEDIHNKTMHLFNGVKTSPQSIHDLNISIEQKIAFQMKLIHYKHDGTPFWNELTCHPMKDDQNVVHYLLIFMEDATSSSLSRMISRLEIEVYEHLEYDFDEMKIHQLITDKIEQHYFRNVNCIIHVVSEDDTIQVSGCGNLSEEVAKHLTSLHIHHYKQINCAEPYTFSILSPSLEKGMSTQYKTGWIKSIYSKTNEIKGFISFYFSDEEMIADADKEFLNRLVPLLLLAQKYGDQKKQLKLLAFYDTAIHVPNANYFRIKLEEWITSHKEGIIILIQPTEYSKVVDLYGRPVGDELLRQIVERLHNHRNEHIEFIGRFSNSLIIASCIQHDQLDQYESRIRPLTISPYIIEGKEIYITLKIGIGYFDQTSTVDDSIRQADIALTSSRGKRGTQVSLFEKTIDDQLKVEMDTLNQLTNGLKNNEFHVHLQPKIEMCTNRLIGFEALSRWSSPKLGPVSPGIFIPLAEQSGQIKDIDVTVMRQVLQWLESRLEQGLQVVPVAINISPDHFYQDHFIEHLKDLLGGYNVPAKFIKLELTESIELVDFTRAKDILMQLKELGIDCSIDDFGVGFSSLSYLPKLPFSELKIDQSFINSLDDVGMLAVIQTIIQLATNLKMKAVAEGIETKEQYEMLAKLGCHTAQGYFLYKPLPLVEAAKLLNEL